VKYLQLIRWPNLLIIALVQYLLRLSLIEYLNVPHALNHWYFALGVLCSLSLAAAGYVVNDLYDRENDAINKPAKNLIGRQIDENQAWYLYYGLNALAVLSGYLLAQEVQMQSLWFIPLIAAALLYLYAIDLKKRPLLGNVLVSLLTAMPVFLVGVFDVLPAANAETAALIRQVFRVIVVYALFAFWVNLIRELVKDAQDLRGDAGMGFQTLAILLGAGPVRSLIFALALLLFLFTAYFNAVLFQSDLLSALYVALFVNGPLLFFLFRVYAGKSAEHFRKLSTLLKLIMLTGILSILIFSLALKLAIG